MLLLILQKANERAAVVTLKKETYSHHVIAKKQKIFLGGVKEALKDKKETGAIREIKTMQSNIQSRKEGIFAFYRDHCQFLSN